MANEVEDDTMQLNSGHSDHGDALALSTREPSHLELGEIVPTQAELDDWPNTTNTLQQPPRANGSQEQLQHGAAETKLKLRIPVLRPSDVHSRQVARGHVRSATTTRNTRAVAAMSDSDANRAFSSKDASPASPTARQRAGTDTFLTARQQKLRVRKHSKRRILREGMPPQLIFHDAYAWLLTASWKKVVGFSFMVWFTMNFCFALLYFAIPDAIEGSDGSFLDACWFSIHTFSTIGYGSLGPKSGWTHLVVLVEAFVSLYTVALLTGLIFAKFARAHSRVLFSSKVIVELRNSEAYLMFRMANERGNRIMDCTVSMSVLIQETTDEGEKLTRPHSLKVVNSHQTAFSLTWAVMHKIDSSSPLFGRITPTGDVCPRIVVSLRGFDETFGVLIHDTHTYTTDNLRVGYSFKDCIVAAGPDNITFKFNSFHQTMPQNAVWPRLKRKLRHQFAMRGAMELQRQQLQREERKRQEEEELKTELLYRSGQLDFNVLAHKVEEEVVHVDVQEETDDEDSDYTDTTVSLERSSDLDGELERQLEEEQEELHRQEKEQEAMTEHGSMSDHSRILAAVVDAAAESREHQHEQTSNRSGSDARLD